MFCRGQAIGLAVFMFGTGLLIGSLLPSCLPVWLIALAVIAAGLFLLQCCRRVRHDEGCCMEKSQVLTRNPVLPVSCKQGIRKSAFADKSL